MKAIHLQPGIVAMIRRPFDGLGEDNQPGLDQKTGETVWYAEAAIAGELSGFGLDDTIGAVRLKSVGTKPDYPFGSLVALNGNVTATVWSTNSRGNRASNITISAESYGPPAVGATFARSGGIPIGLPADVLVSYAGQGPDEGRDERNRGLVSVMFAPVGLYAMQDNGVADFRCASRVEPGLEGKAIELVDPRLFYSRPDREDVSARNKAAVTLWCRGVRAAVGAPVTNGRSKRDHSAVAVIDAPPSEG